MPGSQLLAVGSGTVALPELNGPWDEQARLASLRELRVAGRPPDPRFDSIVSLMRSIYQVQVALVSLVEAEELTFLAKAGEWPDRIPRAGSFCDWIFVAPTPNCLIFEDLAQDIRFVTNPYVVGPPGLRFYAGAPLLASNSGHRYGTLCILDFKPRSFTAEQYSILVHFAELVTRELERDKVSRWHVQGSRLRELQPHLIRALDCFEEGVMLCDPSRGDWPILYSNDAWRAACGMETVGALDVLSFWQLFELAGPAEGPYDPRAPPLADTEQEARAAAARLVPFAVRVVPRAPSDSSSTLPSAAAPPPASGAPLTIHFKPSGTDETLRADAPAIGIPSFVELGPGSNVLPQLQGEQAEHVQHQQHQQEHQQEQPLEGAPPAGAECTEHEPGARQQYYFAVVQPFRPPMTLGSPTSVLRPQTQGSSQNAGTPSAMTPSNATPASTCPSSHDSLQSSLASSLLKAAVPAFYHMRPKVFEEVTLGPLIGCGSTGRCYRAFWQGANVVVKILDCFVDARQAPPADPGEGLSCAKGAVLEALLSRSLAHPHILPTYEYAFSEEAVEGAAASGAAGASAGSGRRHQQVWILQAYCNRGTLIDAIERGALRHADGSPNLQAILQTAQEVAGAMAYLHQHGVLHADLNGNNILLSSSSKDSRRWIVQVADFGLSRLALGDSISTQSFGTVTHMPPELLLEGRLSPAADVFSCGMLLWEMWAGRRAWRGMNAPQVMHAVTTGAKRLQPPADAPPAFQDLVRRCLEPDPKLRPCFEEVLKEITVMITR